MSDGAAGPWDRLIAAPVAAPRVVLGAGGASSGLPCAAGRAVRHVAGVGAEGLMVGRPCAPPRTEALCPGGLARAAAAGLPGAAGGTAARHAATSP